VAIDVHGSEDRAKDVSPGAIGTAAFASGGCAWWRHPDDVPLLGKTSGHLVSPARPPAREETRTNETDRPRPVFFQRPAKGAGFQRVRCLPPPRSRAREDCSPTGTRDRPPAHAAHTFSPGWGECFNGPCKRSNRGVSRGELRECGRLFRPRDCSCLGLTSQARPRGSVGVFGCGGWLPPLVARRPQRLDGFYDRESVARCADRLTGASFFIRVLAPR
jgi:hypothetical protein